MITDDTVKLLIECNTGMQMGVSAIGDVLPRVQNAKLEAVLEDYKNKHKIMENETKRLIQMYGENTKEPKAVAKVMSRLKTNAKMYWNESDATVSDLVTDGCNMGIKSVRRYMNKYDSADECSKEIAKRLIDMELELAVEISPFL